jgi:hypothetical protein
MSKAEAWRDASTTVSFFFYNSLLTEEEVFFSLELDIMNKKNNRDENKWKLRYSPN